MCGSLILNDTKIAALPDHLTVGGNLDLRLTEVSALPEDLQLGGEVLGEAIDPGQVERANQRYAVAFGPA